MEGVDRIPYHILLNAQGLVFLTILKVGFMLTGRVGTGLVTSKLPDGTWSAPSAIGVTGVGWGFQVGTELSDVILVLNTQNAVNAFTSESQIAIGSQLGVSVGPVGRTAGTDLHIGKEGSSAAFSYAHSKGLFVGISLEASGIFCRDDVNRCFYGHDVKPATLLSSKYPKPLGAEPLYRALSEVLADAKRSTGYDEVAAGGTTGETYNADTQPTFGASHPGGTCMKTADEGEFGLSIHTSKRAYNSKDKEMTEFNVKRESYRDGHVNEDSRRHAEVGESARESTDIWARNEKVDNRYENDEQIPPPLYEVTVDNSYKDDHSFISDLTTSEAVSNASDSKSFDTVML